MCCIYFSRVAVLCCVVNRAREFIVRALTYLFLLCLVMLCVFLNEDFFVVGSAELVFPYFSFLFVWEGIKRLCTNIRVQMAVLQGSCSGFRVREDGSEREIRVASNFCKYFFWD